MNEDVELVQACRGGCHGAFETIVRRYQNLICAITYSAAGRLDTSEELAQETFVQAWKNLNQLKEPQKLRGWLCSIARNLIHNHIRSQKHTPDMHPNMEEFPSDGYENNPEETLIRQEEEEMIQTALMQIPEEYREPLVLFYRQDQSTKQVAETLGLPEATVRTRLHRGRKMLRQQMEAKIARTLKKSAPGAIFTRSVMAGIGAGLAAGLAGGTATAGIVTAAETGTAAATAGGFLTAAFVKIAAIAAAVIVAAGAVIYSIQPDRGSQPPAEQAMALIVSPQKQETETAAPASQDETTFLSQAVPAGSIAADHATSAPVPPAQTGAKVRHPDWPGLNEPIRSMYLETRGFSEKDAIKHFWASLPDKVRDEATFEFYIIDNGRERLTVYPDSRQAQLGPTWFANGTMIWMHQQLLEEHPSFSSARMFRDPNSMPEVKLTPLPSEDEQVSVYKMEVVGFTGTEIKAWVDKRTLLPERIEAKVTGPLTEEQAKFDGEMIFDFTPIPEEVFSTTIPSGFQELPPKVANTFTGRVIDWTGTPISGADVCLDCWTLGEKGPLRACSDENGLFTIKMRPFDNGFISPVVLWAISPKEPELFAWTMLISDQEHQNLKKYPLGGPIPGDPGVVYPSDDYLYEQLEDGSRTRGVWCAGASDMILVLEQGISVSGTVSDIYGMPVAGAEISAGIDHLRDRYGNRITWSFPKMMLKTLTDKEGRYTIRNLPRLWSKCSYLISVTTPAEALLVNDTRALEIEDPNEPIIEDFVLLPKGPTVRGVLKDNYGTPLPERYIYVQVNGKGFPGFWKKTNQDGRFEFTNCPADEGLQIKAELSHNSMAPHEPEKFTSYVYYPDVTVPVGYEPQKDEYELELTAIKPEIKIEAVLTDSAGHPLAYFPVEIQADENISTGWKLDRQLYKRADENGQIQFTNVPEMKGLRLVCSSALDPYTDRSQTQELQQHFKELKQIYQNYHWTEAPVPLEPGQKQYRMHVVILTEEEHQR